MRYHIGLGIGHIHTQHQASSDSYQETAGTRVDDVEVECIPELPDDEEELSRSIIQDIDTSSEHSSDFCDEREEEEEGALEDEEFLLDEDMYRY
jgi:hypothetical protein